MTETIASLRQLPLAKKREDPDAGVDIAALRALLSNRRVALLWDLDNVDFFAPASSAPLQLRRMQELVAAAGGRLALCRAYANYDTAQRLRGVLPLLERWRLMEVALVPDTDFAAPLRHLSERGVVTIAVSPHEPRRRTHAAMEPATHFRRLPLPSACWAALQWRAQPPAPVSAAEAAWLAERLQPPPTMMASTQPPHAPLQQMQQAEAAVVEARQVPGGWGDGTDLSAARSMACPQQEPEAAAPAPKGAAAAVPRGLVEFAREGHPCPGAATRLWLNPAFPGTPCVEKAFGG
eukprot:XP_001700808.1 predicted protein [Chlamydomonas reinhardtii]